MGLFSSIAGGVLGAASSIFGGGGDDEVKQTTKRIIPPRGENEQEIWDQYVNMMIPGEVGYEFDPAWYLEQHPEVNEWIEQGKYARPEIPGYTFDYDRNLYIRDGAKGKGWGGPGTGSLKDLVNAKAERIRNSKWGYETGMSWAESQARALESLGLTPNDLERGMGEKRTPYMHYEQIGKGKGYQPSAEAKGSAGRSIFDTVGTQQDWLRSQGLDFVSALEAANQAEKAGVKDATDTYLESLATLPTTQLSFGGQPVGEMIHRRPMEVAGKRYQASMAQPMHFGELDRMVAGQDWQVDQNYPKYAGELAAFQLLQDIVNRQEDRRYGTATTSTTKSIDSDSTLWDVFAGGMEGARQGSSLWDLITGAGNVSPTSVNKFDPVTMGMNLGR